MKRKELYQFKAALDAVKNYSGMKFRYAFAKNVKTIKAELETFEEMIKPSAEFTRYQQEGNNIRIKHAKKTPGTDACIIENNSYVMNDLDAFTNEFLEFKAQNLGIENACAMQEIEFNEFLEGESELEIFKMDADDVPEEIPAGEYADISFMIHEPE